MVLNSANLKVMETASMLEILKVKKLANLKAPEKLKVSLR